MEAELESSLLLKAAEYGDMEIVQNHIQAGDDIHGQEFALKTFPLHKAAASGCLDIVSLLLDHNACVNAHDEYGNTPMHLAAENGNIQVAQVLWKHGAELYRCNFAGQTPCIKALMRGHAELAQKCISWGAPSHEDINGETCLHKALRGECFSIACQLIKNKCCDLNAHGLEGETPLHIATQVGSKKAIDLMMRYGADIDAFDKWGQIPCMMALAHGCAEIAQKYIDKGAELSHQETFFGDTCLHKAIGGGCKAAARKMIRGHICHINTPTKAGDIPLHIAASNGHRDLVDLLMKHGSSIDVRNKYNDTPCMDAFCSGHEEIVHMLIASGAQTPYDLSDMSTCLYRAIRNRDITMVKKILREYMGSLHDLHDSDLTPLHVAVIEGDIDLVHFLLQHYIEVDTPDRNGMTPCMIALMKGYKHIAEILISHEARLDRINCSKAGERQTCLHCAIKGGCTEIAKRIISRYPSQIHTPAFLKETPLHMAGQTGNEEVAYLLIKHGADVNATDIIPCETPCMTALKYGHVDIAEACIKNGSRIDFVNDEGATCITKAFASKCFTFIKNRLQEGICSVYPHDQMKRRYFDSAVMARRYSIICQLLQEGARPSVDTSLLALPPVDIHDNESIAMYVTYLAIHPRYAMYLPAMFCDAMSSRVLTENYGNDLVAKLQQLPHADPRTRKVLRVLHEIHHALVSSLKKVKRQSPTTSSAANIAHTCSCNTVALRIVPFLNGNQLMQLPHEGKTIYN